MIRTALLIVVSNVFIGGIVMASDEDPIEMKLTVAKEEYDKATEKSRARLLADLKKRVEVAQRAGDLQTMEKIQGEIKSFEDDGSLPKSIPVKSYEAQQRMARARLEESLNEAVRDYTKDGRINLAKVVQLELDEFNKGRHVKTGGLKLPALDAKEWSKQGNGLRIWDVKEGTGIAAERGVTIKAQYTGWLIDGTVFDSTRKSGEAVEFRLTEVNKGWAEGVPGMKVGGVRRLVIPPELAYGNRGAGKAIPPNATLVFEIELLEVKQ